MKKTILLSVALIFIITISRAQTIPNAGFETWNTMSGYNNPDAWSSLNDMTAPMSTYTCTKGTPGSPGSSYLKLTSKTVSGIGVVPGIAVCGIISTTTMQAVSGFAFNQRPANLAGKWQHMIFGSSQGYIDVKLTRWDAVNQTRVTVASKHQILSGMAMSWAAFTVPLTYSDGSYPDSCIITFSASGAVPADGDYLWVDNLSFSGTVAGIAQNTFNADITVFPNPAIDKLTLNLNALHDKYVNIEINNIQGKLAKSISNIEVTSNVSITVADLSKGNYVLNIFAKEGIVKRNFIKQ